MSINTINNFESLKSFVLGTGANKISSDGVSSNQTVKKIKDLLEEGIQVKLNKNDVQDVLPCILRAAGVEENTLVEVSSLKTVLYHSRKINSYLKTSA